jgi:hypothetical protein
MGYKKSPLGLAPFIEKNRHRLQIEARSTDTVK